VYNSQVLEVPQNLLVLRFLVVLPHLYHLQAPEVLEVLEALVLLDILLVL
jgi:hypothetical protein